MRELWGVRESSYVLGFPPEHSTRNLSKLAHDKPRTHTHEHILSGLTALTTHPSEACSLWDSVVARAV